ncbi:MAG: hypothetical protein CMJ90_00280 [Planctomycetes bacterium]|nr:hypothetical protein [Planctomycetota bacterium]
MDLKQKNSFSILLGVGLLLVNVVLFNVLLGRSGIRVRADLTEGNAYTVNEVTRDFLQRLDRPAEIIFYHSSPASMPAMIRPIVDPLKDAIAELAVESGGKVKARFITLDTKGKKAQDAAADAYGVRSLSIPVSTATEQSYKNVYFSVVVASGDRYEHIALSRTCPLIRIVEDFNTFGIKLELTDPEYVLARTLRKVVQTYGSVAGAIIAQDLSIKLTAYLSDKETLPQDMQGLPETIQQMRDELEKDAKGRFSLAVVDPWEGLKSMDEKQRAAQALFDATKVRPIRGATADFYAWLLIDTGESKEFIELYKPGETIGQADLKTAVEGSLKRIVPGFLKTVGIVSPTPPQQPMNPMMPQQQPPDPFAVTREFLSEAFQVTQVTLASGIERAVDILLVLQPGDLTDQEVYALDQFVMRGGRVVLCGGGFHGDLAARGQIRVERGGGFLFRDWLRHFGIDVGAEMVLDSASDVFAFPVLDDSTFPPRYTVVQVKYPFFLTIDQERMSSEHPITAFQQSATMLWACPVGLDAVPDGASGTILMRTTGEASTTQAAELVGQILDIGYDPGLGPMGRAGSVLRAIWGEVDHAVQTEGAFPPTYLAEKLDWVLKIQTRQEGLAAAVKGEFTSYFADKPVPGAKPPEPEPANEQPDKPEEKRRQMAPLEKSQRPGSIVVFGDSDAFSWLAFRSYSLDERTWEENMGLLRKALEWSSDDELAAIRGQRAEHRPLTELDGLGPDERAASVSRAQWLTFTITSGLILMIAGCWWMWRQARQPITLISRTATAAAKTSPPVETAGEPS